MGLEQYEIIGEIAETNHSKVLKAKHKILDRTVVVKRTLAELVEKEAKLLGKIEHPNIVQLFDAQIHPEPYLALEYMPQTLRQVMGKPIPEEKIRVIMYAILRGIEHAHSKGIIHGDLKPENILIDN